ncbi:methionyl-tRNA formyltransferase [Flagellatimonas centrodinii]|uniref:methionyl-tRNA formyltransferase n=1 Tax=Flagellatimonas centrodinii TaxID=2806210 RepID=UPI001FED9253|nr:methionyl-tRNA formyltransferase [Flagellatimonas centrodinii]ULQ45097.1 methionyl-tRNA formyltransferase [Flagellatimonas centrodinii]
MRIAFAGTPAFAGVALEALIAAGHDVAGVFTQPDRPAGRGRKLSASPVADCADRHGLPCHKPDRFRDEAQALLRQLDVELMVVVAYGLILPAAALVIPPRGCLNIHASLLPRWRGAAPIQRAIEAGDRETGITIMQMDAGLDTGPMLMRGAVPIGDDTTAADLHDRLAVLGGQLIVDTLAGLAQGQLTAVPQPPGATYAAKLDKAEARIDWTAPAAVIARRIRAFNPVPVAWTTQGEDRLRLWLAQPEAGTDHHDAAPGQVLHVADDGIRVQTGDGVLRVTHLQWPGGTPLDSARVAAQGRLQVGARWS